MEARMIMVRYGELSTKGKNKKDFIAMLANNIRHALKKFKTLTFDVRHDHIYINLNEEKYEDVKIRLTDVSGLYSFSPVYRCDSNIEAIKNLSLEIVKSENLKTFKVKSKRADKEFPIHSDDINRSVATHILKNSEYRVDVHNPDILLNITVRENDTFIFYKDELGAGGYPLGIAGKSLMMLSGGIDSPVAAYLMMKRGIKIECIHFASPPYTSSAVIDKIKDLCKTLTAYQPEIKLYIVPFTTLQEEIYKHVHVSYAITIMRRMMYRIANIIASRHKDLVISNGESIGQVASQTLKSIQAIEGVSKLPVIRPLAVVDKIDIIKIAKKINTFDISIRPYEDCCTIFEVKDPTTAPNKEKIEEFEKMFNWEDLVSDCANEVEVITITDEDSEEEIDLL